MHRTHKCHKPAHQGGKERQELCSSVLRPSQRLWIFAPPADPVSNGVVPYTRDGPGNCQKLLWRFNIVTGCTIYPILFFIGMGMVTGVAERETRGPSMDSGIYQPPIRGFMDDLIVTTTTTTHKQARWVLSELEESFSWARMKFKS